MIEPTDLEAGLAKGKGKGPATTMTAIAEAAAAVEAGTGPAYPRARADSLGSDTGAVVEGGALQDADDQDRPRQQRRRTLIGQQQWAQESAVAGPSSSAHRRARGRTIWPSTLE